MSDIKNIISSQSPRRY